MNVPKYMLKLICFVWVVSCNTDNDNNHILPNVSFSETLYLNNPQFINLTNVGGWAYAAGGIKGLIIYHAGIRNYIAFERNCPHITPGDCSQMTVKGLVMYCSCDASEFSILNGSPVKGGNGTPAKAYRVRYDPTRNTLTVFN